MRSLLIVCPPPVQPGILPYLYPRTAVAVPLIHLLCASSHAMTPGIVVGAAVTLAPTERGWEFRTPATGEVMRRVAHAFRDGALVLLDPHAPFLDALERQIMADRDRLLAEADALLSEIREHRQTGLLAG